MRPTPYLLTFAEQVEQRFPVVQREAHRTRRDATDPAQFASLTEVQHILADIESPPLLNQQPAAAAEYLMLLYAAFRFWEMGKLVLQVTRGDWAEAVAVGEPGLRAIPSGACYLQFPERWFWAQIGESAPHEPLDGIFLARSADGRQLVLVAVLGLRVEREGFSQVSLTVAPTDVEHTLEQAQAPLFPPLMDGGAEAGFRSLHSAADLVLVAHLALVQATR